MTLSKCLDIASSALEKTPHPKDATTWHVSIRYTQVSSRPKNNRRCIESAIAELQKAVDLGYRNWRHMEQDSDLDAIRAHPGYQEILATMKKPSEPQRTSPPLAQ